MPKKCSCKKLIGGELKTLILINYTGYNIEYMWITASTSEMWDYEVELINSVSPGEPLPIHIDMAKFNSRSKMRYNTFDVLIYDKDHKEYHEYRKFKDLNKKLLLTGKGFPRGKHEYNPKHGSLSPGRHFDEIDLEIEREEQEKIEREEQEKIEREEQEKIEREEQEKIEREKIEKIEREKIRRIENIGRGESDKIRREKSDMIKIINKLNNVTGGSNKNGSLKKLLEKLINTIDKL